MEKTIWVIKDVLNWSQKYLAQSGSETPRLDSELLLCDILECKRIDLYVSHDKPLSPEERKGYRDYIRRRASGEPVAYILGYKDFFGYSFKVDRNTLIPRPETEHLIEKIIECYPQGNGQKIRGVDIGTGSGCIALTLSKLRSDFNITGWDSSALALEVALENARRLEVVVDFENLDILNEGIFEKYARNFDFIVSNPPYISFDEKDGLHPSVLNFEPHAALFASHGGMVFYHILAKHGKKLLKQAGKIFLEIGYQQSDKVCSILEEENWRGISVHKDLSGHNRVVIASYNEFLA